jgi:hypothetical protein
MARMQRPSPRPGGEETTKILSISIVPRVGLIVNCNFGWLLLDGRRFDIDLQSQSPFANFLKTHERIADLDRFTDAEIKPARLVHLAPPELSHLGVDTST